MMPENNNGHEEKCKRISLAVTAAAVFLVAPPQLADMAPFSYYLSLFTGGDERENSEENILSGEKETRDAAGIRKQMNGFEYEIVFTDGISNFKRACVIYPSLSLSCHDGRHIMGFVRWFNLKKRKYLYRAEWYDGSGELLVDNKLKLNPDGNEWLTWTWIKVDRAAHVAGTWKFKVYLDGKLAVDEKYHVYE